MKKFLLLSLLFFSSHQAFAIPNQFKGTSAIEIELSERLMAPNQRFSFFYLLDDNEKGRMQSLFNLMGFYAPVETGGGFRNGNPNATNTLLWQLFITLTANEIAKICDTSQTQLPRVEFGLVFKTILKPSCSWPAMEAKSEENMKNLWLAIMGYQAPYEEFEAWRGFFLQSSYASGPAKDVLPAMIKSIMYNPHFLMRK